MEPLVLFNIRQSLALVSHTSSDGIKAAPSQITEQTTTKTRDEADMQDRGIAQTPMERGRVRHDGWQGLQQLVDDDLADTSDCKHDEGKKWQNGWQELQQHFVERTLQDASMTKGKSG